MNPPPTAAPERAADDSEVIELSTDEYHHAVEQTLKALGFNREDLSRQADEDDFDSPAAFMMWNTIRGLVDTSTAGEASS
jgi:hypothetical protein